MANERTFLAWIRTNIGIMAFGFVIEKFGIFLRQIGLIMGKGAVQSLASSHGYSATIGIFIVVFGILMNLMAYINFKRVEKQINERVVAYQPSGMIYAFLVITIIGVGLLLVFYLFENRF